jgi:hypothetical protein
MSVSINVIQLTHGELSKRGLLYSPLNIGSMSNLGNPFNPKLPDWETRYRAWLNVNWKTGYKPLVNQIKTIVSMLKLSEGDFYLYTDTPVDSSHTDIIVNVITKMANLEEENERTGRDNCPEQGLSVNA